MYTLQRDWRRRLGVRQVEHAPRLLPGEGLGSDVWAENEFGGAKLGDKRRTARLVSSAALLAEYPGARSTRTRAAVTRRRSMASTV